MARLRANQLALAVLPILWALITKAALAEDVMPVQYAISSEGVFSYQDTISFSQPGSDAAAILGWPRRIHTEWVLVDGSDKMLPITGEYSESHRTWKSDLSDKRTVRRVSAAIRGWAAHQSAQKKLVAILFPNDGLNYPGALKNREQSQYFTLEPRSDSPKFSRVFDRSTRFTMGYMHAFAEIASELEDIANLMVVGGFYHHYNSLPLHRFNIQCDLPKNFVPMIAFYNTYDRYIPLAFDESPHSYEGTLINFGPVLKGFYDCAKRPVWVFEYYWKLNWLGAVWPEYHVAFSNARTYRESGLVSGVISQDPGDRDVLTSMLNRFAPIYGLLEDGSFSDMLTAFCKNSDEAFDIGLGWCLEVFSYISAVGRQMSSVNGRDRQKLAHLAQLESLSGGFCSHPAYDNDTRAKVCDQIRYSIDLGLAYRSKGPVRCEKLEKILDKLEQRRLYGQYVIHSLVARDYVPSILQRAGC